jgi:LysR family nitrogen assimilation transcriptional regulator
MELKTLRYFEYVAELKSFSKAAVHVRVEQPALSRQMRKLEEELGVQLFTRHGRGVELTEAGELLLGRARALGRELASMVEDVRSYGTEFHGTVSFGAPPGVGDLLVPQLLAETAQLYPRLKLEICERTTPGLYRRLLNKELSVALLHNPEPHRDLVIVPMVRDVLYLIGPGKPLNGLDPVKEGQAISNLPMILPRSPHNRRLIIDRFCIQHGIELDVRYDVDGFTIIEAMVEAGFGYSILGYYGVQAAIVSGRISAVPVTHPEMPWELCVVYRRDLKSFRPIDAIIDLVGGYLRHFVAERTWWPDAKFLYRGA